MIKIFASLIRQLIFWMIFFALNRAVFLIYYHYLVAMEEATFGEIMAAFWHALRLDLATASYIIIIPFLLLILNSFFEGKIWKTLNKAYSFLVITAYTLICTVELGIYGEWKSKLHYKALHYLSNPEEVYNTASTSQFIWLLLIFLFLTALSILAYHRFVLPREKGQVQRKLGVIIMIILVPVFLFIGIRGGVQEIPITQAHAFYSNHNILNLAAVNSGYNFTFSMLSNYRFMNENPYRFMKEEEARAIVDKLNYSERDSTTSILSVERPNIVIILLESWTADLIYSLGGEEGITPEFEKLVEEGFLFKNFFASGNRSEQAMSAIFGGFPATPIVAITHNLDKVRKLPSMPAILKEAGYNSSFFFGGHLMYGGIKSYLTIAGFDEMTEIYDLPDTLPIGKLGVHDEALFDYQIAALNTMPQPFFSVAFTLSSHSPYDQPMEKVLDWGGSENEFINSAYYTDHCLGEYFRNASLEDWYDSTLFIIVADHSHNSYRHWDVHSPNYRKIPLLLYGNVLKAEYRGQNTRMTASQVDIPSTILNQLQLPDDDFYWSKDLFNPFADRFAFYETNNGYGWIRAEKYTYIVWEKGLGYINLVANPASKQEEYIREAQAYLQMVFQEYMDF
jgi:phosphoglycerol transferase MdoB-like AlkP superfamily enzyme